MASSTSRKRKTPDLESGEQRLSQQTPTKLNKHSVPNTTHSNSTYTNKGKKLTLQHQSTSYNPIESHLILDDRASTNTDPLRADTANASPQEQSTKPGANLSDNTSHSAAKIPNKSNNKQTNNRFSQWTQFIDQRLLSINQGFEQKLTYVHNTLLHKMETLDKQQQEILSLLQQNAPSPTSSSSTYLFCGGEISKCEYLRCLKQQMTSTESDSIDDSDGIKSILENYLHLMIQHSNDQDILNNDFEYIYRYLGADCNIQKCSSFGRHSLCRRESAERDELLKEYNVEHDRDIIRKHTIDKIHCFYRHSYDIGHRLTPDETNEIILAKAHNKGFIRTRDILSEKQDRNLNSFRNNGNKLLSPLNFITIEDAKPNIETEETREMYKCGFKFDYDSGQGFYDNGMAVHPQYDNIKEELLINTTVRLSIGHFDCEHQKAELHYQCQYFRSYMNQLQDRNTYTNHDDTDVSDTSSHSGTSVKEFKLHHILALMVYCNFTTLQCKLSETYRRCVQNESKESILKRHSTFYFLAKYLNEAVNDYGVDSKRSKFYHGINKELLFSKTCDISIYCPLSTSSSYAVAINFATSSGIIIELTP
eukprot:985838_1